MKEGTTKKTVFSGLFWRFAERFGAQGVSLVVSVVLARLLDPGVYGTVALVTVFTNILETFADSGFGNALIRKKDADDLDFSTVFWFNTGISCLLYLLMFILAPSIARFYSDPALTSVVRVLSLTLVVFGVKNLLQAFVSRNMLFRKFFFATLGGTIGAAVIGIRMAYAGFGIWALIAQQLFNTLMDTIILWISVRWKPRRNFSFSRLKELFGYGWRILASGVIDKVYNELRQLIIGKLYTTTDLANYNRGRQFPNMLVTNINTAIDSVLLPALANEQDDRVRVKMMTRRAIKVSVYVLAPLMIGLICTADPLVRLMLTEKWLPCIPYLRIFCITYIFYPIHTANLNAIKAMGRSDIFLKLEIAKKAVGLIALFATMRLGVMAMAYSLLFTSLASQVINSWPNKKLLDYSYFDQMKDILPSVLLAAVMGAVVYPVIFLPVPDAVKIVLQVITGAVVYITESKLLKPDSYEYLKDAVKIRH